MWGMILRPLVFALLPAIALISCEEEKAEEPTPDAAIEEKKALLKALFEPPVRDPSEGYEFVGAESCRNCHQQAYDDWETSHHHAAMAVATPGNGFWPISTTFPSSILGAKRAFSAKATNFGSTRRIPKASGRIFG